VPTAGAADQPAEHRLGGNGAVSLPQQGLLDALGGVELGLHDECLVGVLLDDLAAACLPEVDRVLQQPDDAGLRPVRIPVRREDLVLLKETSQLGPRGARRSAPEALGNDSRSRLIALEPTIRVATVASWRVARDMNAAPNGARDRRHPVLFDALQLELGDQGQDPDRKPAHRRTAVEVVFDGDKPGLGVVQTPNRSQGIDCRAGEAIEPGDNDPTCFATLSNSIEAVHKTAT
jgi:hypothetical protein